MTGEIIPRKILRRWRRQSMGPMSARASRGTVIPIPTPIPNPVQSLFASEWGSAASVNVTVGNAGVLVVETSLFLPLVVAADSILVLLDDRVDDVFGDDVLEDVVLEGVVLEDVNSDGDELGELDGEDDEGDEGSLVDWTDDMLEENRVEVVVGEEEDEECVEELIEEVAAGDAAADDAGRDDSKSQASAMNNTSLFPQHFGPSWAQQ